MTLLRRRYVCSPTVPLLFFKQEIISFYCWDLKQRWGMGGGGLGVVGGRYIRAAGGLSEYSFKLTPHRYTLHTFKNKSVFVVLYGLLKPFRL